MAPWPSLPTILYLPICSRSISASRSCPTRRNDNRVMLARAGREPRVEAGKRRASSAHDAPEAVTGPHVVAGRPRVGPGPVARLGVAGEGVAVAEPVEAHGLRLLRGALRLGHERARLVGAGLEPRVERGGYLLGGGVVGGDVQELPEGVRLLRRVRRRPGFVHHRVDL